MTKNQVNSKLVLRIIFSGDVLSIFYFLLSGYHVKKANVDLNPFKHQKS